MDTDLEKIHDDDVFIFAGAPLVPEKYKTLEAACTSLGIERSTFVEIEISARQLRNFQVNGKARLKTPRERIKALQKVEKLASDLSSAIQELDLRDCSDLWERLPERNFTITEFEATPDINGSDVQPVRRHSYSDRGGRYDRVPDLASEVENLAKACHEEYVSHGDAGRAGGRKSTLSEYAWHVREISEIVKNSSMPIGRGGPFEALCKAIFEAAGVHASPEGAIREALKNREVPW